MHQTFHSTQTWTFKGRTETITSPNRPSAFPGPANYTFDKPSHYNGATVVGKDKRDVFPPSDENPGPGTYLSQSFTSDGPKRTMSARHNLKPDITPSPQTYQPNFEDVQTKPPAFSMSTKSPYEWSKKDSDRQPAPTSYNPESSSPSKSTILGHSKRKDLSEFQKTPGPAAYNTIDSQTAKKNPRTLMGSAVRRSKFDQLVDSPGPGNYNVLGFSQRDRKGKKGYTMRPMTADVCAKQRSRIPGPGRYNLDPKKSHIQGFSSGTSQRKTFIDEKTRDSRNPPPGTYNIQKSRSSRIFSFGYSKRRELSDFQKTPGPAIYDINQSTKLIVAKSPGYSMGKSTKGIDGVFNTGDGPGPTNYNPSISMVRQSSRISQMSQSKWMKQGKGLDSPGVGVYNIKAQHDGGCRFTKEKRVSFTQRGNYSSNPSPRQYDTRQAFPNPPKYMMNGTYKSKMM